jgi:hypothetical protein
MSPEEMEPAGFNDLEARRKVSGPATALLVTGIIGVVLQVLALLLRLTGIGLAGLAAQQQGGAEAQQFPLMAAFTGTFAIIAAIVGSVIGILIIVGANKMKGLESYGLAMTASILAMIPCISPCCLLGLPFGIWSLVVLSNPEVKSAFH